MTMQPQLWGGLECTVNRVHDRYRDQIKATGHHDRPDDLDLLADIGIRAIRYPILWERVSPDDPNERDWRWTDERLRRLGDLGIEVIAGLIHHGSGPAHTSLLDNNFAPGLAGHAAAAAERYPWITDWTPVNEPLTTARFSALYGHWYPHRRSEHGFWLALLNQVDATRLSMRAIRRVNPAARLIQTDDLGRTYATMALREQAGFDNLRRWAGWDLLCGRIVQDHPLWDRICAFGFQDRLRTIADDPCPPGIIGINHYLTSDRLLDHRLQRYPAHSHGGSENQLYADVEAIRVLDPPPQGLEGALREAWHRYGIPLAITEAHNGCTREEQMRWVAQAWDIARRLCGEGIPVEGVTLWSLLGSSGWNTLLTGQGHYEPGVWDVSGGTPRATALLPLAQALSGRGERPLLADTEGGLAGFKASGEKGTVTVDDQTAFLARFGGRFVNTHPALLPSFPGAHGVRDALAYGAKVTGCTVHFVDDGVDTGPIIAQGVVEVRDEDDESALHERIKEVERRLLVEVVGRLARNGYRIEGRKVVIQ